MLRLFGFKTPDLCTHELLSLTSQFAEELKAICPQNEALQKMLNIALDKSACYIKLSDCRIWEMQQNNVQKRIVHQQQTASTEVNLLSGVAKSQS